MLTRSLVVIPGRLVLAGLLLGGCVLPEPPIVDRTVDATSPLAARVVEADAAARTALYPDISAIPAAPVDQPSETEWRAVIGETLQGREALQAWAAANPPELTDTAAFVAGVQAQVGLDPATLPPAPTPEESAAYARAQRERVEPAD